MLRRNVLFKMRMQLQVTALAVVLLANVFLVSAAIECGGTDATTQTEWQLIYEGRVYSEGITTFSYRIETETDNDSPLCSFGNWWFHNS